MELNVGIIGLNADRGWAREAHAPAIQQVDGLRLAAVATRRQTSADAAAQLFQIEKAYGDPRALIADPDIDVVAVVSAVPTHRELILAALKAGKHVLTEWPVAVGTEATRQIAEAAEHAGVHTAVGLQARTNPAVLQARRLLREGTLGRVRMARVFSSTAAFGPTIDASGVPLEDPDTGMNLTTIQGAHTLDLVSALAGPFISMTVLRTIQFPTVAVVGSDPIHRTLPDHVLVQARLHDGGSATVEIAGGRPSGDTPFRLELEAERGTLVLTGGAPRGFQAGVLELTVNGGRGDVAEQRVFDTVVNVAGLYTALRNDIRENTSTAPTFDDSIRLSRLIDDVVRADGAGVTVSGLR